MRAIAPDAAEIAAWGTTDHLLAFVADLLGKANFKNYEPIERPEQAVAKRRRTDERRRALIERYEARQRADAARNRA